MTVVHNTELAIACTGSGSVHHLLSLKSPRQLRDCLGPDRFPGTTFSGQSVSRLYLGNEFCERLVPAEDLLEQCLAVSGLDTTLVTPIVSDQGLQRYDRLLGMLPDGAEVIINDWGMLQRLRGRYPSLTPIAGRLLCKMIKDPRLPAPEWSRLYPTGAFSAAFSRFLQRFGIHRLEVDAPPRATAVDFPGSSLPVSVHMQHGYVLKGRMCRIGSAHLPAERKFAAGHGCQRECLDYVEVRARPQQVKGELQTFQRGNTLFYHHSPAMTDAVLDAAGRGHVDRLIFRMDWHEDYRPH